MPASDIGAAGGTAAAAKAGDVVEGWLFRLPPRRSNSTAIRPMMAITTAPPTAMPTIAPIPSFDPLLDEEDGVLVAPLAATVIMPGTIVVWPGATVMTEVFAPTPAELPIVTVDIIVFEFAAKVTTDVWVAAVGATVLTTVVPATGAGVVAAGLAQEFHCA